MLGGLRPVLGRWVPLVRNLARHAVAPPIVDVAVTVLSAGWGLLGLLVLFRGRLSGDRPRQLTSFLVMDQAGKSGVAAGAVLIIVASLALLWRRRRPVVAFAVVWSTAVIYLLASLPMASLDLPALVVTYSLGAYAAGRAGILAALAGMVALGLGNGAVQRLPLLNVISAWVQFAVLFLLGRGAGTRRRYLKAMKERSAALEAQRAERILRAVAEERARAAERQALAARELHDVMSQTMAVVAAQAGGAAGLVQAEPGQAKEALEQIAGLARDALEEIRGLLHWLRAEENHGDSAGLASAGVSSTQVPGPQWPPGELAALVQTFRRTGLAVEFVSSGVSVPLDREVLAVVYRVVQESLTNVLKHAGPADTVVEMRYAEDILRVQVTNAGGRCDGISRDRIEDTGIRGAGLGLRGLRERVESRGGSFQAGPVPGAGFRVQAVLPAKVVTACPYAS
jgi:signal transduction histidine kinase